MITREQEEAREQVKSLRPGDVVEIRHGSYPDVTIRGALHEEGRALCLGHTLIRDGNGAPVWQGSLTVVSRAPRPLYVNHPRTEPVPGDVVRDADSDDPTVWACHENPRDYGLPWLRLVSIGDEVDLDEMPTRLRLLVDGETGQVVP